MQESEFDRCPNCGSHGIYGLRCHPKFATCYETMDVGGFPDMGMAYFHTQHENDLFAANFVEPEKLLYKQRWNPESTAKSKWEEYI